MTYIVEQQKGQRIYVYRVESYWDSDKQQPRQRRVYVGKKETPDGPLIAKRSPHFAPLRSSRDYGHVYLLRQLAERLGLPDVLASIFPTQTELLLLLAMYEIVEERPLYLFPTWSEGVVHGIASIPRATQLSALLQELGRAERRREAFFRQWIHRQTTMEAVVYDITSISSQSRNVDLCEWGYNRDGEPLPQVNLGLVCGLPSQVPLAYRVYPGSLADVVTLPQTITYLHSLGITHPLLVLDRGFWSRQNVQRLHKENVPFLVAIPFTTAHASAILAMVRKTIRTPPRVMQYQRRLLYHQQVAVTVEDVPLTVQVFFDPQHQVEEEQAFYRRVLDCEEAIGALTSPGTARIRQTLDEHYHDLRSCFTVETVEGATQLVRKPHAITRRLHRMGYLLLATTAPATVPVDDLRRYRLRDLIEKLIDSMKHEMDGRRLRVHSTEAMQGRLFLLFLSMILRCAVEQACREAQLLPKYTVAEVFAELRKVKQMEMADGTQFMTELTRKQRMLYEAFKVPLPT